CLSLSPTLLSPPAAPSQLSPLSLHDALPISSEARGSVPGPDAALSLALPCSGCRLVPGAALFRDPPEIERHPPPAAPSVGPMTRSEEHTSELQSRFDLVCRLLLETKKHHTED